MDERETRGPGRPREEALTESEAINLQRLMKEFRWHPEREFFHDHFVKKNGASIKSFDHFHKLVRVGKPRDGMRPEIRAQLADTFSVHLELFDEYLADGNVEAFVVKRARFLDATRPRIDLAASELPGKPAAPRHFLEPGKHASFTLKCGPENGYQGADYRIIALCGREIERVSCIVRSMSPYFRFGIKLFNPRRAKLLGESIVKAPDDNILIHIGRNDNNRPGISANDIFLTYYVREKGNINEHDRNDRRLFTAAPGKMRTEFEMTRPGTGISFAINGEEKCLMFDNADTSLFHAGAMFAWSDDKRCEVVVEHLLIDAFRPE